MRFNTQAVHGVVPRVLGLITGQKFHFYSNRNEGTAGRRGATPRCRRCAIAYPGYLCVRWSRNFLLCPESRLLARRECPQVTIIFEFGEILIVFKSEKTLHMNVTYVQY